MTLTHYFHLISFELIYTNYLYLILNYFHKNIKLILYSLKFIYIFLNLIVFHMSVQILIDLFLVKYI